MIATFDPSLVHYKATSDGYTLYYGNNALGGVGTRRPHGTRRHWKHVRADLAMHAAAALREANAIKAGHGQERFKVAIADVMKRIDVKAAT
jgi:hypothetical protein